MTVTETYCTECDETVQQTTAHCPSCGAADAWDQRAAYRVDESDLPYVFSYEVYNDTYGLWRAFAQDYLGSAEIQMADVAGVGEEFPSMKYCVFQTYWRLTKEYELQGPFLSRQDALIARHDPEGA